MKIKLLVLFMLPAMLVYSQTIKDWIALGDQSMDTGDPYGALRYYKKAMEIDSLKGTLLYRIAEAYRGVQNYPKAAYYYERIYRRDRGTLFEDTGMKLAQMQMQAGMYDEAKENWRRVRKDHEDEPQSYEYRKAVQSLRSCDLAKNLAQQKSPFELDPAPRSVNTPDSEFAGYWFDDGRLGFSALRGEYDQEGKLESEVYRIKSYSTDTVLENSVAFKPKLYIPDPDFGNYVRGPDDAEAMVVINPEGQKEIHLYQEGNWTKLLPILEEDTSNYTHPAFGRFEDKEVLYFASDRPDGKGGYDIWYIEIGNPAAPQWLTGDINSPGDEVTPFYRIEENEIYFASDWHHGIGGFDIFKSELFEGAFSYPENIRKPFNSAANDLYYSFNSVLRRGSVTSNRVNPDAYGGCCNDIYFFREAVEVEEKDTLPQITTLDELNEYLPVTLYFHNDEPDPRTRKTTTDSDYIETYREYLNLLSDYRKEYRRGLSEREGDKAEEAMEHFFTSEVDQGVEDLSFFTELLLRELEEGNQIELTVRGFASPLAATDYNVNLTKRRISSLENYLKNYKRGVLRPFLNEKAENGGFLRIAKVPFGEYVADKYLSDNPNESNSIYSIAAAKERKIEIVSVSRALDDTSLSNVLFEREVVDLGQVKYGDSLKFSFEFQVQGQKDFAVDSLSIPSTITLQADSIYTNGIHEISGIFAPEDRENKGKVTFTIFGNIPGRMKELNLTFESR